MRCLSTRVEFLQIDALRSYVLDTRLRSLMHADVEFTERVWAAAMTFPALQEAASMANVAHLARLDANFEDLRSMLRRCCETSLAQTSPTPDVPWIVPLFVRTMRSALRARASAALVGAAGAA